MFLRASSFFLKRQVKALVCEVSFGTERFIVVGSNILDYQNPCFNMLYLCESEYRFLLAREDVVIGLSSVQCDWKSTPFALKEFPFPSIFSTDPFVWGGSFTIKQNHPFLRNLKVNEPMQ